MKKKINQNKPFSQNRIWLLLLIIILIIVGVAFLSRQLNQTEVSVQSKAAPPNRNACTTSGGSCLTLKKCGIGKGIVLGDYICPGNQVCCDLTPPTPTPTAIPIPTPTPTIAGKRIFITSSYYNANLGGLSGADLKCQNHADTASLGGVWKAWLSDSRTSAASRLNHSNLPYVRTDGTIIAENWADLTDGNIITGINYDEHKVPYWASMFYAKVWTNTKPDGSILNTSSTCKDWTSGSYLDGNAVGGIFSYNDGQWTADGSDPCSVTNTNRLYCVEQ